MLQFDWGTLGVVQYYDIDWCGAPQIITDIWQYLAIENNLDMELVF